MSVAETTAPVYGNYHNYHYRHLGPSDPRLSLLPSDLFKGSRVLDIGCNDGSVTCEIAQVYSARLAVGVDIDAHLIHMAWKRRRNAWSSQKPYNEAQTDSDEVDYFPASCAHMFGPLPIPAATPYVEEARFPHNISFRCADWANTRIPEDDDLYDLVVAFSVTKWIHLNNGDDGIKRFFQRVYDCLVRGGRFILEPQNWDSYAKGRKMHSSLHKELALRPEESFENILEEVGFGSGQRLGILGEGRFKRPVTIYIKLD